MTIDVKLPRVSGAVLDVGKVSLLPLQPTSPSKTIPCSQGQKEGRSPLLSTAGVGLHYTGSKSPSLLNPLFIIL